MIFALFAVVALASLGILWVALRGRAQAVTNWDDLPALTEPVDLAAFRNLMDPAEEDWLRKELPAKDYTAVRRERASAAIDYLSRTNRNAAIMVRLGQAAMISAEPGVAAAGGELVNTALLTRWYVFQALLRIHVARVIPAAPASMARAMDQYQRLREHVDRVGRMRSPVLASRMASAL